MNHGKHTVCVGIEDQMVNGVLVAGLFSIMVEWFYNSAEYEGRYMVSPSYVEIEPWVKGSQGEDYIYLGDDIMLDPIEDRVLYQLAASHIIEWMVDNYQEQIEQAFHDEAEAQEEY